MLSCLLCLLVLFGAWFVVRVRAAGTRVAAVRPDPRAEWLGATATLVATFPLLRL